MANENAGLCGFIVRMKGLAQLPLGLSINSLVGSQTYDADCVQLPSS